VANIGHVSEVSLNVLYTAIFRLETGT